MQFFTNVFRQKHRNLHVFRSKTLVFAVFSMLWHPKTLQNIAIYNVFSFLSVFPLPEAYQNDTKLCFNTLLIKLRHPKIVEKSRKHHLFWSRCETVFAPPPQLKLI